MIAFVICLPQPGHHFAPPAIDGAQSLSLTIAQPHQAANFIKINSSKNQQHYKNKKGTQLRTNLFN